MIGNRKLRMQNAECRMQNARAGFTLVEVLVALSLFAVVVTIATDLFLSFQRTSRKTQNLELVVTNARLVTERIARELRDGSLVYARYADGVLAQAQTDLYIRSSNGAESHIYLAQDSSGTTPVCPPDGVSKPCIALAVGNATESLTGTGVRVRDARFFIAPTEDPFEFVSATGTFRSNAQPRVTMSLSFDNTKTETDPNYARYDVQTTISSRIYRR